MKLDFRASSVMIWFLGSLAGLGTAALLIVFLPWWEPLPGPILSLIILAAPIGLGQWLALRRLRGMTPLWLLTIPLGFGLGALLIAALPAGLWVSFDDESPVVLAFLYSVLGGSLGLVQGVLLSRRPGFVTVWVMANAAGFGGGFWVVLAGGLINRTEFGSYLLVAVIFSGVTGLALEIIGAGLNDNRHYQPSGRDGIIF